MKVLFIGGTGTISTEISRLAGNSNIDLYLLNRGSNNAALDGVPGIKYILADMTDEESVAELLEGQHFDVVANFIVFNPRQAERDIAPAEQAQIDVALKICAQHSAIDLLARRDARKLAQLAATLTEDDDSMEQLDELVHRFTLALKLVQSLEPAGVGARNLAECLTLQLRSLQARRDTSADEQACIATALKICAQHGAIDLLARRDVKKLAQLTGCPEDAVRAAAQTIARLDPKPGRPFADVQRNIIIPDVIVSATGSGAAQRFQARINPDVMPRLRVQDAYAKALRGIKRADREELTQRLQEARWFVKNIRQRFDTILRVATAIVERQRSFFIHGEVAMRPLVQHDLAEQLGLHDSTISRITTAKYMATPRGTFELKYFFGSALATEAGGNASSTAVRALIKQLIAAEEPAKPLSDQQITDILKDQGIECARRTVAKYREGLRIPVANLRRAVKQSG
jgi:RNA polymerase sigma-54 factor